MASVKDLSLILRIDKGKEGMIEKGKGRESEKEREGMERKGKGMKKRGKRREKKKIESEKLWLEN